MAKYGIITNLQSLDEPQWVDLDKDGYPGVRLLIRPQTRSIVNKLNARLKAKKKESAEGVPEVYGDKEDVQNEMFTRELADMLLKDWEGVCDAETEEPLECNRRNKILFFENLDMAILVLKEAKSLAGVRFEDDEKNFEGSSAGISALPS